MEDSPYYTDTSTGARITENFFIKSEYIFLIDSTNKNCDHIMDHEPTNAKAYEPFFSKFNHIALLYNFLNT